MKEKVVLAYSGGLDTSIILKWLLEDGYEVIAYLANLGQDDDFAEIEKKALKIGASKVYIEDVKEEFVRDYIFEVFKSNAIYEKRYLLGTSIARPLISKKQIEIAVKEGATYVAHGATGKGNDQVRFELSYYALKPDIKVIAPWKNKKFLSDFKGRGDMLDYATKHNIPVKATADNPYSEDDNLLHISHEAGLLENVSAICPKSVYSKITLPQDAPDVTTHIDIEFKKGIPVKVTNLEDNTTKTNPLDIFMYLNKMGSENGIGRLDMVENRFVGIKSRGVYETPGGLILYNAHIDLEGITVDKEVLRLQNYLADKYADYIYNGFWFCPEVEFIQHAIDKSQELVNGTVTMELYKGNAYPVARKSPNSFYDDNLSSMDIEGGYNQMDSEGFIKINAVRLKSYNLLKKSLGK